MPDPIMYQNEDAYVVLEPNQPEQFLTSTELFDKLKSILIDRQADLPPDLQRFSDLNDQATYLMETSCELDVGPEGFLQWYAVRLEK
ncbi:chlororespiratory reduction protein 7 [Thermocoleostomius sinensis]|uniref:Chlororespiratory reduction protein 7 n=1 Tax=Thermocoleostomius sinensis A174 TaxID=2016057 RepID=A0A9E8ZB95_9CYAN|nr:chlororespiratory reduction protein 7 [Thermocoleostomius sinensis]WAL58095.1 chlororespiratory reduction protein 7 [Thermocoleostomius sinensis A174]